MNSPDTLLDGYEPGHILCKKVRTSSGKYLYSFRDPKMAMEEEIGYFAKTRKKNNFDHKFFDFYKNDPRLRTKGSQKGVGVTLCLNE